MGTLTRVLVLLEDGSGVTLPSGKIPQNNGFGEMMLRIGLFMLFLLVFVFVCAYAWKILPGLRALIPGPKPAEEEVPAPRLLSFSKPIVLTPVEKQVEAKTEVEIKLTGLKQSDPLKEAIADGRPGSVVRAASDLPESQSHSPIIILKRED